MTYTLIGRCQHTGRLGIGITTWSLGVGGYCPFFSSNKWGLSSQAAADPRLGQLAIKLLELGYSPSKVIKELRDNDPYFNYRQIGIIGAQGIQAVHTGSKTRPWTGHRAGDNYIAMGNTLDSEAVIDSMAEVFRGTASHDLDERLLLSLEAGREAGGQQAAHPDEQNQDRSASLIIYGQEDYPLMDLRVDVHQSAVEELRRVRDEYKPYIPLYHSLRVKNPDQAPAQAEWLAQQES